MPTLPTFTANAYVKNVEIYKSTRAIDVPDKLNAVSNDFKTWFNTELISKSTEHINSSMTAITNYLNNDIIAGINTFKSTLENNIGVYLDSQGAGYSIPQVNSFIFSGNSISPEYDSDGRVTRYGNQYNETFDCEYNEDSKIIKFKEKITISGIPTVESYEVTYDNNNFPKTTKV